MKIRKELNSELYHQKIYGITGEYISKYDKYAPVSSGNVEEVRNLLKKKKIMLILPGKNLSKDPMRNALYHFVLAAADIAEVCEKEKLGHTEALCLAELYIKKADECGSVPKINALFRDMCTDFAERMAEIRKSEAVSLHVRLCISYIYENLGADLTVKTLAKRAGLDPAYFSRLFRKETGTPLKQFVKEARIDTAQKLLLFSGRSCAEISSALGYSSQSKFIEAFKSISGMTPKTYRDKYCNNITATEIEEPLVY